MGDHFRREAVTAMERIARRSTRSCWPRRGRT
jgi:hypothetical protein